MIDSNNDKIVALLEGVDIKPTPNRVLVMKELMNAGHPMSLIDLEYKLETLERSSVLRALNSLKDAGLIHAIEDGRGVVKYETCHGDNECTFDDMHVHFYCEKCERVFCFESERAPRVDVPEGYEVRTVNYMLKGICPDCKNGTK